MRADGLLTAKGLRLCEFNMGQGIGGPWQAAFMSHWLGVTPDPRDGIRGQARDMVVRNGAPVVVGVLDENGPRGASWIETRDLIFWLMQVPGVRAFRVAPSALRPKRGRMADRVRSYDVLYQTESVDTRCPSDPEIVLIGRTLETSTSFASDPIDMRIDDKALMALLSAAASGQLDERLSHAECALVNKYVPWTRLLGDYPGGVPVSEALERRGDLVLKRTRSLNSEHVFAGRQLSQRRWRQLLECGVKGRLPWVVQERLIPQRTKLATPEGSDRRECMVCPFVYGLSWAGALVRVAERGPRPFVIAGRRSVLISVVDRQASGS